MAGDSARDKARRAREKSERLARYAEKWEKGAEGESHTAAALAQLGPGWTHWHDLKWPGRRFANIDHLAIGPGGIFVIDSKNWSGAITVKDNVLRQNGYRRETAVASCADSALAVGELLPRYLDRTKPVLCFVREDQLEGWVRDVMLCSTTNLVPMLTSRDPVLGTDEIADAIVTLQARMNSMPGAQSITILARNGRPSRVRAVAAPASRYQAARRPKRIRSRIVKRIAAGLGLWYLACISAFFIVQPHVADSGIVLGPIYAALAFVSWLLARRLIK
ncbi:MAG: hypothetical protein JWQ32_2207 [Marmoricola sp.]|nr:hypothetical protein [Marmoricola sp.]